MTVQQLSSVAIHNVAVATDFSECSERAVEHAMAIARHFGATLHLLHLVRPSKYSFVPEMMPAIDEAAGRDSEQYVARLTGSHQLDGVKVERWVEQGEISDVANGFVNGHHIDMLIVGTHGRSGIPRLILGSVAQQIFHSVRCPVLVVGPRAPGAGQQLRLKKVLFATDLSHESLAALPFALTAVEQWHTELDVLHICTSGNAEHPRLMNELRAKIDAQLDSKEHGSVRLHLLRGKPMPCLTDFACHNYADAIILGLKPHRGLYNAPFWSHAYEIMRHAPCPVLSVRG
jgi:nucleotide-binding universal stress UspA family protein